MAQPQLVAQRDHPRVCGEQVTRWSAIAWRLGSSPRVRGTDTKCIGKCNKRGIIPACAGNSVGGEFSTAVRRDHPRVCGEQPTHKQPSETEPGSSPRVRGTVYFLWQVVLLRGIIPACAGNRTPLARICIRQRDHPRVCGEQPLMPSWHWLS